MRLHVTAPDVDVATEAFIKWVRGKLNDWQAILPPMVDIDQSFDLNNIFHSCRVWNMYVTFLGLNCAVIIVLYFSGSGIGVGVERTILDRVIEFSTNDLKLCRRDCDMKTGFRHLNLSSIINSPQRWNDFQALGWISAAYIFITGQGPEPFSPVLPLFAIGGWAALTDLWLIDQVLPDCASILRQWPVHYDSCTINLAPGSTLASLVIEHLDTNVSPSHFGACTFS